MLGGDVQIESSKKHGSTFIVTLPTIRLLHDPLEGAAKGFNTQPGTTEMPQLGISLFIPRRWETGDAVRDQRRLGLLLDSLTQSLRRWFHITVIPWESASTNSRSRLLIALKEDEDAARLSCGGTFDHAERILLYPDVQTAVSPYTTPSEKVATIAGPITISKLQDALAHLFPNEVSPFELRLHFGETSDTTEHQERSVEGSHNRSSGDAAETGDDLPTSSLSRLELADSPPVSGEESVAHSQAISAVGLPGALETGTSEGRNEARTYDYEIQAHTEQAKEPTLSKSSKAPPAEPKLLLVDDNAVNLKVLTMYARKCSKTPATSVGGGREAIDAFKSAIEPDDGKVAQPFDLIFLDLSMPDISGFDVAREIRETEARLKRNRTYICALTGLVSGKDRNAAYESGVDNYLVRPTRLKDLQGVIELWRNSSGQQ
jgi:CheY-like chemotaxis protein